MFILLLLVSPMALHNHDRGKKEAVNTVSEIDDIAYMKAGNEGGGNKETRAVVHREEDEYGGSWFDDFTDESGVEWKENVSIEDGKVTSDKWIYSRSINITNNGGALSDFQVQVNLTPQNFDYTHAKNNGGDVRFYAAARNKLNYWIEEWNTSGDSKIWVNVTNIPNGESRIQMFYGNPSAESESNGTGTF